MSKTVGRAYLVKELGKRGLSRRRSLRVLNFLFGQMKQALAGDEKVEFAGGTLQRKRKSFGRKWDDEDDWPAHRQPNTVEWVPNWETLKRLLGSKEAEEKASEFVSDEGFAQSVRCRSALELVARGVGKHEVPSDEEVLTLNSE